MSLKRQRVFLILLVAVSYFAMLPNAHATFTVSVAPTVLTVPEGGPASYTVTVTNSDPGAHTVTLSLSPSGSTTVFSPNPVTTGAGAGASVTSALTFSTSSLCPGSYTVTVVGTAVGPLTASGSATLIVAPTSPALSARITSSKSAYQLGETINFLMTVNKPAFGTLIVTDAAGSVVVNTGLGVVFGSTSRSITASQPVGRWTARFEAAVCSEITADQVSFDVTPDTYDVNVAMSGLPDNLAAELKVDGNVVGTVQGNEIRKLSFKIGTTHSVEVAQIVQGNPGERYFSESNKRTVSSAVTLTFEYAKQVLLDISSDAPGATLPQGGWYKPGTPISIPAPQQTIETAPGTRLVFTGWEVDGTRQAPGVLNLVTDKSHKVVAKYKTQHLLTVVSQYGNPPAPTWYDAGTTATVSLDSPSGLIVQQVFVRWEGDFSGTDPKASMAMDKPRTLQAVWTASYLQLYILIAAIAAILVLIFLLKKRRGRATHGEIPHVKPTPGEPPQTGESKGAASAPGLQCPNCGSSVKEGQEFCHACGAQLAEPQVASA